MDLTAAAVADLRFGLRFVVNRYRSYAKMEDAADNAALYMTLADERHEVRTCSIARQMEADWPRATRRSVRIPPDRCWGWAGGDPYLLLPLPFVFNAPKTR